MVFNFDDSKCLMGPQTSYYLLTPPSPSLNSVSFQLIVWIVKFPLCSKSSFDSQHTDHFSLSVPDLNFPWVLILSPSKSTQSDTHHCTCQNIAPWTKSVIVDIFQGFVECCLFKSSLNVCQQYCQSVVQLKHSKYFLNFHITCQRKGCC